MRKPIFAFLVVTSVLSLFGDDTKKLPSPDLDSPFGICSHLTHAEFQEAEQSLKLIKEAGIDFVRTGFPWGRIEKNRGELDYYRFDTVLKYAEENGITVSANFPSGVPKYVQPFPRNLDIMAEMLEKFASHYKGKVKYWEMVNEPNHLSFWGGLKPNAKEYATLLKKIKQKVTK